MIGRVFAALIATICVAGIAWGALSKEDVAQGQVAATAQTIPSAATQTGEAETSSPSQPDDQTGTQDNGDQDNSTNSNTSAQFSDEQAPNNFGPAGTLTNLDGWLQTDATSLEEFDGQILVLQFWTFSCHNCKATIPSLQQIYADHHDAGVEIIGVHAPEFSFEEDPDAVLQAAQDLGVTWPIAIDNNKTNFRSWQGSRRFWPRTYVIDVNGDIRFDHIGEGSYDELQGTVAYLVHNGGA